MVCNPLKHLRRTLFVSDICFSFFEVTASFALFINVVICILSSNASHQIQRDLHSFHLPRHISGFQNSFQDCCEGHSRESNRTFTLSSLASMKPLRSVSYFRQAYRYRQTHKDIVRYCQYSVQLYVHYISGWTNEKNRSVEVKKKLTNNSYINYTGFFIIPSVFSIQSSCALWEQGARNAI